METAGIIHSHTYCTFYPTLNVVVGAEFAQNRYPPLDPDLFTPRSLRHMPLARMTVLNVSVSTILTFEEMHARKIDQESCLF